MANRRILTIGDLHGRSIWKEKLFGSTTDFNHWSKKVIVNAKEAFETDYPLHQWDKVIFIGDYADSFTVSNVEILQNLKDLILLKTEYQDKIILLLGNHDVQYIVTNQICSGYRAEMRPDLYQVFNDNLHLFQMAYYEDGLEIEGRKNRKVLWTHAGVTEGWLSTIEGTFLNEKHKKHIILRDYVGSRVDEMIEIAWQLRLRQLFSVDTDSGGVDRWAGPLWVRPGTLQWESLSGFDQIIGHTAKRRITTIESENNEDDDVKDLIIITDCLEFDNNFYEIEY
jgi:hypothetical protein